MPVDRTIVGASAALAAAGSTIKGTGGDDTLVGDDRSNNINPFGGNDYVDAKGGDDYVHHSYGDDTIYGGDGNDTLRGGFGRDTIYGGPGRDLIDCGYVAPRGEDPGDGDIAYWDDEDVVVDCANWDDQ